MIRPPATPAPRGKKLPQQQSDFTAEGAPPPSDVVAPATPRRSGPNVSRVPAGIPGAHHRAPTGKRRMQHLAMATLLVSVPMFASADDRDVEGKEDRGAMSFQALSHRDDSKSWRGGESDSRSFKLGSDDDEREGRHREKREGDDDIKSAVPEPGAAALLLAGLTAVGFVVRRRRHPG